MVQRSQERVRRSDGVAGTVLATHTSADALHVRFEDGLEVVIPRALLREEQGLLRLEQTGAELAELRQGITRIIPVIEETAHVATRTVDTGGVRVQLGAEEYQSMVEVPLERVQADVTRVPVNRVLDDDAVLPQPRQEGDTLIIPVIEEEVVLIKRRVLKEELRITRSTETTTYRQPVTLRRSTVAVEPLEPQAIPPDQAAPPQP